MTLFSLRGALCAATLTLCAIGPNAAHAEYKTRNLLIVPGEVEFEHNGSYAHDRRPGQDGEISTTYEFGYAFTGWWQSEVELEAGRDPGPGNAYKATAATWENTIRFTEIGEYWADLGLFGEYSHGLPKKSGNSIQIGPILQKDIGHVTESVNILFGHNVGDNHDDDNWHISYATQTRWNLMRQFSPAFEIYGDQGAVNHVSSLQNQDWRAGPVLTGVFLLGGLGKIKYEAGYLFGVTRAAQDGSIKWRLEWETRF